ncbi:PREDICTED: echinoderm microtubule-associated protein-like CG42247, partial [Rhagoletis zephyria]|uniref:echinoderm microtubule-associated protein-like CG42247 n=1 Tax=Rhagoletis zephyria TaxID=28612 RepID=UPI0008115021
MSANEAGDGAAEPSNMANGVSANEPAPSPSPSPAPTTSPPARAQSQPPTAMDDGNATAQISSAAQFDGNVSAYGAVKQFNESNNNNNSSNNNNNTNANYTKSNGYHYNNNNSNSNHPHDNSGGSNRSSPLKSPRGGIGRDGSSFHTIQHHQQRHHQDDSDNEDYELQGAAGGIGGGGPIGDYWQQRNGIVGGPASGRQSRALSPTYIDNMSENSEQPPVVPLIRSKSRPELSSNAQLNSAMSAASRYNNLSYWKARRVVFYRNGDPFFPGVELRYRPGRDITSLDSLLDKISPKMDLPRGARYVFSMDGDRKYHLDELEDGASYVVSSFKAFK